MKTRYTEEDGDSVYYTYGYEKIGDIKTPYFFIDTSGDESITLSLTPSQLRRMAMKMIKMSCDPEDSE